MWFDVVVGVVALVGAYSVANPNSDALRRRGESFARWNNAYVDSEFVPMFDRATRWGYRFYGLLLLLAMATALLLADRADRPVSFELAFLPVGSAVLATWALFRLHNAGREFPAPRGHVAVARARRVTLSDYIALPLQLMTWFDVAAAAAIAGVVVAEGRSTDGSVALKTVVVLAVAALGGVLVLLQLAGRALCNRPQSAVDACHLYFQDAWRAEFLVRAHALVAGGTAFFLLGIAIPLDSPAWVSELVFTDDFPYFLVFYGIQVLVILRYRLHFRRRLWPTLAPGQVLLPGQPVPPKVGASA